MGDYRLLPAALLISFSLHTVIISGSYLIPFIKPPEAEKQIKVTYVKIKETPKELLKSKNIASEKRTPPPFIEPQEIRKESSLNKPRDLKLAKPQLIKPDSIPVNKKISLPDVDMGRIDNPSYISYYQIVREKIRRAAFRNYSRSETGEVYLTFIISSDGLLKDARLVEAKSSRSPYLRSIALSSVKTASPFPNFPKELDYQELSFNVIISFEIE
ncbi:MAG: TonB family protein [Candidatus Omnitrophota bacterium]|jgi:TonB family protein